MAHVSSAASSLTRAMSMGIPTVLLTVSTLMVPSKHVSILQIAKVSQRSNLGDLAVSHVSHKIHATKVAIPMVTPGVPMMMDPNKTATTLVTA